LFTKQHKMGYQMNILLINHYAGSVHHGMEFRPYYLSRELTRLGHHVHIIAASESHVRQQQPDMCNKKIQREIIDGIQYTWLATPTYEGNGIARVLNMAVFVWRLFWIAKKTANSYKPDIVIASSTYPMDIWPARKIAKKANAKLVFEVHDLWPLTPIELGNMSKWHPFILLMLSAESYAYRHADSVISMLPKARNYMESRGMKSYKYFHLPNGYDPKEWDGDLVIPETNLQNLLLELKKKENFIIGYAGSIGIANALDTLLDAAVLLKEKKVAFVIVGSGASTEQLKRRVSSENINNVFIMDAIIKTQVPVFLKSCDILYIGWRKQPLYRFGISPNKIIDYMLASRPILHSVEAGNDPVTEAGCGITVSPEDPASVSDAVRDLYNLNQKERTKMGKAGCTFATKNYSYPVLAKRLEQILQTTMDGTTK
jgi:glycosyltransferase involved in cell wall biosynthesis